MRNRLWILLSLLLVATLVLAACGGSPAAQPPAEEPAVEEPAAEEPAAEEPAAEEAPTEEPAEEATEEPAEEAAVDGPTLTIWADEVSAPVLDGLSSDFAAENGINVVVVQKGFNDLRNDYKVAAPTGEGPDILLGAHDWLGEYNASGLLAEVSLGDKADLFAPNAVDAFTYTDGKLYGMPVSSENVAFYYNTDLVAEPPATWDEVKTLSQELKDAGNKYGFLIQANDPYHFYPIQTAFGGYVFGKDENGAWNPEDVGLNSEGTLAAFEWLDSMYKDGLLDPGANIDAGLLLSAFQNGDAAMVISGPWALGGFREAGIPYADRADSGGRAAGRSLPWRAWLHDQPVQREPTPGADLPAADRCQRGYAQGHLRQRSATVSIPAAGRPDGRPGPGRLHGSRRSGHSHAQHSRDERSVAGLGRRHGTG